ncbi:MAG: hypothetical protein HYZ29_10160 [Myxococcales bacterium]|nr:hypothetical protein [Myxococcales bacterium]
MAFRDPTPDEMRLLRFLGRVAGLPEHWVSDLSVEGMADGGMGSLILRNRSPLPDRQYGQTLSACQFDDRDGIAVIASLYGNQDGTPIELDVWKVDFSPVQYIAAEFTVLDEADIPRRDPS